MTLSQFPFKSSFHLQSLFVDLDKGEVKDELKLFRFYIYLLSFVCNIRINLEKSVVYAVRQ